MFSKQKLFECRDRPRRDIARILAEQISKNYVHYMQRQDGTLVSDMVGKLQGFFFNKTSYTAKPATDQEISGFLASAAILKVKEKDRVILDTPIQLSEIHEAIKSLKTSKVPGFDELTEEFYKKYRVSLVPRLLEVYGSCLLLGKVLTIGRT